MLTAIDLFAGIGGNTQGAKDAGLSVLWAANHNRLVVDYHKLNHPDVVHSCQDLQQADWSLVPRHDVLLASPCCQGHTRARGKEGPHHHRSRSTAWAPLSCIEYHRPSMFMIENVPEMLEWSLFPHWKECLKTLGYSLSINVLDSGDYGVPQNRIRAFIIGTKSKHPITLNMKKVDPVPFASIMDLDLGIWSAVDKPGRAQATLDRVANAREAFGDVFVMPYYKSGSGKTGRSIHRPLGTVTTRDRWAIVVGNKMRMVSVDEYRKAMSFPASTCFPPTKKNAVHAFGNATCPGLVSKVLSSAIAHL